MPLNRQNAVEQRRGVTGELAYQVVGGLYALKVPQQDLTDILLSRTEAETDDPLPVEKQRQERKLFTERRTLWNNGATGLVRRSFRSRVWRACR